MFGLLRGALAGQGRATLERMQPAERATSTLINQLGRLLRDQGDLDGAEALFREAMPMEARRETLGDKHPSTLTSINNLGSLLDAKGDLDGAEALYREALEARRETLGDLHPDTLDSISNLGALLKDQGDLDGAEALGREARERRRRKQGASHETASKSEAIRGSDLPSLAMSPRLRQQRDEVAVAELCVSSCPFPYRAVNPFKSSRKRGMASPSLPCFCSSEPRL